MARVALGLEQPIPAHWDDPSGHSQVLPGISLAESKPFDLVFRDYTVRWTLDIDQVRDIRSTQRADNLTMQFSFGAASPDGMTGWMSASASWNPSIRVKITSSSGSVRYLALGALLQQWSTHLAQFELSIVGASAQYRSKIGNGAWSSWTNCGATRSAGFDSASPTQIICRNTVNALLESADPAHVDPDPGSASINSSSLQTGWTGSTYVPAAYPTHTAVLLGYADGPPVLIGIEA